MLRSDGHPSAPIRDSRPAREPQHRLTLRDCTTFCLSESVVSWIMSQSTQPPSRSAEQRHLALRKANEVRARRATDKQRISARLLDPREVLTGPAEHWERAKIAELLLSIPAVGRTKTERILRRLHISPSKTVGGMTPDQRQRLAQAIASYCVGPVAGPEAVDRSVATAPVASAQATGSVTVPRPTGVDEAPGSAVDEPLV